MSQDKWTSHQSAYSCTNSYWIWVLNSFSKHVTFLLQKSFSGSTFLTWTWTWTALIFFSSATYQFNRIFKLFKFISLTHSWFTMLCYFLLYSKVIHILFHYGLSWDIYYSSLCYTLGPCCLCILYWQFASINLKLQSVPPSFPLPHGKQRSGFYVCESVSVSYVSSFVSYFRLQI